jgi:predicted heme/steroid binding protein
LYRALKVTFLAEEPRKFTLRELEEYDGKDGKPAYIAYKGKVYDVSESSLWIDGDHLGTHQAGKDLTEDMELAPHGDEVLERAKLVGVLV